MKRLWYAVLLMSTTLSGNAQTFLLPSATESAYPTISSIPSSSTLFTDGVAHLSNTRYPSAVATISVYLAAWSKSYAAGGGGGVSLGFDAGGGASVYTAAIAIPAAVDIRVGFLEDASTFKAYAVLSYYDLLAGAYVCELRTLGPSTISATPVFSQTLMTCPYNRINLDVSNDADKVVFTWSDGDAVFTTPAILNSATDALDFPPGLGTTPFLRVSPGTTLGSFHQTLPDVGVSKRFGGGVLEVMYYGYYNDSAGQVDVVHSTFPILWAATSTACTGCFASIDNYTVAKEVPIRMDAASRHGGFCWGYAYTDDDQVIKVRYFNDAIGMSFPNTVSINDGSLPFGPAAMSTSINIDPVFAFDADDYKYHLGWVSQCTTPYAYTPNSYMYVEMDLGDNLLTNSDYLLVPANLMVNYPPVFSISKMGMPADPFLYSVHAQDVVGSYDNIIHKHHDLSSLSTFRTAPEQNEEATMNISAAPNPFRHSFRLKISGYGPDEQISISLADIMGRHITKTKGNVDEVNAVLETSSSQLQAGMYLLTTEIKGQRKVMKMQKD